MKGTKKKYIIHATVNYVVKNTKTGQTENGTSRPTVVIEAYSLASALQKAREQEKKRIGTPYWPCIHLSLGAELVNTQPASP